MKKLFCGIVSLALLVLSLKIHTDNVYVTLPKDSQKYGVPAFVPDTKVNYTASLVLPDVEGSNYRVQIINEELSKVTIPSEEVDELLNLETEQEKNPKFNVTDSVTAAMNAMTNPTRVTVKNTSNRATGFALTALHTTSAKTAFFSKKYNKYVTETPVSEMAIVKPNGAATLLLNTSGVNIASSETVIALMVNAMQVVYKRHVFDEGHVRNETILVTDVKTDSWITNGKKKISINSQQLLEFPNDFIHGLTMPESHQGVNYYNLIAYMRACERIYEYAAEQVQFPASYFDPNYISQLAPKEMDNLYAFIMKQFNQKHIPMPVGLSGLLNCGKYNFIAKGLVQIALSIVMLLIPGSEAATLSSVASDVGTTLQSVVDNSIAIGKGVDSLNAKNKKV